MTDTMTREQLVNGALKSLFIIGAGQEADADDFSAADEKVDSLLAQLRADGVCDITDSDAIPAELFDALTELLANTCATRFGQQFSADKKLGFEGLIRRTVSVRPTYETLKAEYF